MTHYCTITPLHVIMWNTSHAVKHIHGAVGGRMPTVCMLQEQYGLNNIWLGSVITDFCEHILVLWLIRGRTEWNVIKVEQNNNSHIPQIKGSARAVLDFQLPSDIILVWTFSWSLVYSLNTITMISEICVESVNNMDLGHCGRLI